jgi:hypothetical protein
MMYVNHVRVGGSDGICTQFNVMDDGVTVLRLEGSNPTNYQVWHELTHFCHARSVGIENYVMLPRGPFGFPVSGPQNIPEQFVFDALEGSKRWSQMTDAEKLHAIDYILRPDVGGIR